MTTYNGAVKDNKSGKFTTTTPKPSAVLSIRVDPDIKDKFKNIPNGSEWIKKIVTEAILSHE